MARTLDEKGQTDEVLMSRAQDGDTDAFAELYDRHAERAFRVARAICPDPGRAEDAVREGFLAIWRSRHEHRVDAGSFQAWSMQIIKDKAIESSGEATPGPASPGEEAIARDEREGLLASLRRLPEAQAEIIVLAFYGELSESEIAAQLDLPAGTVKGRMRLGLEGLSRELSPPDPI